MIKLDIISGFLGAGKTTLIQKLLQESLKGEKVVLIENEFGEIGVDGSFLKDSGITVNEINSGCICCSLVGDFKKNITEIIEKYNPERIIIEPSGVGKLSDIKKAVAQFADQLVLNIAVTVVDGGKAKMYSRNFGEFFIDQVEEASTIVVSKTDVISEKKLNDSLEVLREINPKANIITTSLKDLDSKVLLNTLEANVSLVNELAEELKKLALEDHDDDDDDECDDPNCSCHHHHHHDHDEECGCGHEHHHHDDDDDEECECCHHDDDEEHHHHHHDHDEECECGHEHHHHHHHECSDPNCSCHDHNHAANDVFTSWGMETAKKVSYQELDEFLVDITSTEVGVVLRAKGILKASDNDGWYYFDYVAGDYEIRTGAPDYTGRICVIGSNLNEEAIEKLFNK